MRTKTIATKTTKAKFSEVLEGERFQTVYGSTWTKVATTLSKGDRLPGNAVLLDPAGGPCEAGAVLRFGDGVTVIVTREETKPTVGSLEPGTRFKLPTILEHRIFVKINTGGARLNAICVEGLRAWSLCALSPLDLVEVLA